MEIEINAQDRLREAGVRVTTPRLVVYQYLLDNLTHPTCEEIFTAIKIENPGISLASVYNVTEKLADEKLVVRIVSPNGERHYDSVMNFHGHFFCSKCEKIFDFPVKYDKLPSSLVGSEVKNITYTAEGYCPSCNKQH